MDRDEQLSLQNAGLPVGADTNIYVSPAPRAPVPAAPLPVFTPTLPSAPPAAYSAPSQVTTTTTRRPGETHTSSHTEINWGGVVKGVAIIGAVVLVGVVGYAVASTAAAWALESPIISAMAATINTNIVAPIGTLLSNAGAWFQGFSPYIWPGIKNFFGGLFGAGTVALAPEAAQGVSSAIGVATAGGLGAATLVHQMPKLDHLPLLNSVETTVAPPDQVDVTTTTTAPHPAPHADTPSSADLTALNSGALSATQQHAQHAAMESSHAALELGHHAFHADHSGMDMQHAEAMVNEATSQPHRSWKEKLLGANQNSYSKALAQNGSHASAVIANRPAAEPIKPKQSGFAADLDRSRAELEATSGQAQIG